MEKIPTAEDFLQEHPQISHFYDDKTNQMVCFSADVQKALIEFAKLHVEAALKAASETVWDSVTKEGRWTSPEATAYISKKAVLNAYPIENIK